MTQSNNKDWLTIDPDVLENQINIDENFGNWTDDVSRFMYERHFDRIFNDKRFDLARFNRIEDFGGANGKLKAFFGNKLSTIDIDETNNPDFLGNVVNYNGYASFGWRGERRYFKVESDLIIIRYVLHYLTDDEIKRMFQNIKSNHKGHILIVQFTNEGEDMEIKKQNSINEIKYFRTAQELSSLISSFEIVAADTESFTVTKEFYRNRLQNYEALPHQEQIQTILLNG
jgi:hypothetical protein